MGLTITPSEDVGWIIYYSSVWGRGEKKTNSRQNVTIMIISQQPQTFLHAEHISPLLLPSACCTEDTESEHHYVWGWEALTSLTLSYSGDSLLSNYVQIIKKGIYA